MTFINDNGVEEFTEEEMEEIKALSLRVEKLEVELRNERTRKEKLEVELRNERARRAILIEEAIETERARRAILIEEAIEAERVRVIANGPRYVRKVMMPVLSCRMEAMMYRNWW